MCRNCHIYVDNAHVSTLPPKGEDEEDLTEFIKNKTAKSVNNNRRASVADTPAEQLFACVMLHEWARSVAARYSTWLSPHC